MVSIRMAIAYTFQGTGHVLHYERPEAFNRALLKFLQADATASTQNGR
jgi:pimeloyl-ACP methyl ester carboxylesterase